MINLAERSYLSIGQVVNYLRSSYPDLSNSKIRFLEDEGLITPHRTPKGYRQYSKEDVDRLEVILHLQKTRYMPLNVIKQKLDSATDLTALGTAVAALGYDLSGDDLVKVFDAFRRIGVRCTLPGVRCISVRNAFLSGVIRSVRTERRSVRPRQEGVHSPGRHVPGAEHDHDPRKQGEDRDKLGG